MKPGNVGDGIGEHVIAGAVQHGAQHGQLRGIGIAPGARDDDGQRRGLFLGRKPHPQPLIEPEHCGTGRRQGNAKSISSIGTFSGRGAISCGGVPNTVARSAAESASPVAGPGAGGSSRGAGSAKLDEQQAMSARSGEKLHRADVIAEKQGRPAVLMTAGRHAVRTEGSKERLAQADRDEDPGVAALDEQRHLTVCPCTRPRSCSTLLTGVPLTDSTTSPSWMPASAA